MLALTLVAATTIATISTSVLVPALATSEPPRNDFGEGARHIGGGMGEHSSQQDEPRSGIGNVLNPGDPN